MQVLVGAVTGNKNTTMKIQIRSFSNDAKTYKGQLLQLSKRFVPVIVVDSPVLKQT